jgi:hypothetical protein
MNCLDQPTSLTSNPIPFDKTQQGIQSDSEISLDIHSSDRVICPFGCKANKISAEVYLS